MKSSKCSGRALGIGCALLISSLAAPSHAALVLTGGGLTLVEQGGTFDVGNNLAGGVSAGAIPFSSSDLGPELAIPFHRAVNLNDEIYGNGNSWIGGDANPFPRPFAGVALDGAFSLQSIAFGRDNLNAFLDRALGLYELQYTTVGAPDASTPDASWTTIGTLDYQSAAGGNFNRPHLRHRFNFDQVDNVTGVRLLVPGTGLGPGTAIDEIELYENSGAFVPPPPGLVITPAAGFAIGFDGNNGPYNPANPAPVPNNFALATSGAIPYTSSNLGVQLALPLPTHHTVAINDGFYGNHNSWIGADGDGNPSLAVAFDGLVAMTSVAFGRDNGNDAGDCCGGLLLDRNLGLYTLQYTQVANPDLSLGETGDPLTGWTSIGTLDYLFTDPGIFESHLRHEFTVALDGNPIVASGVRLKVPGSGIGGQGTAIDELEVYGTLVPEPSAFVLGAMGVLGVLIAVRRRRTTK